MSDLELIPRGPVALNERTETLDYPDGYLTKIKQWREAAREEAFRTLRSSSEYEKLDEYLKALMGDVWPKTRPKYRTNFFDNRLMDARITMISKLTDLRPMVEVVTTVRYSSGTELARAYEEQARIASMVIRAEWYRQNLDLELCKVIDYALFSTGYWKIGAALPGTMTVTSCGIDTVLPIQPGNDLQESTAVLYRTLKPVSYFLKRWPSRRDDILKQAVRGVDRGEWPRPIHMPARIWENLSPTLRRLVSRRFMTNYPPEGDRYAFPYIELEEYWVEDPTVNDSPVEVIVKDPYLPIELHNYHYRIKPGDQLFPRKRLIVFAGDELIYDGPSPFWHGMFPFAELSLTPVVWDHLGLSFYRNLLPLNNAINEIVAGVIDIAKRAVNPQLVVTESAVRDAAWRQFCPDMPGGKLKMTSVGDPYRHIRYLEPPPLPPLVGQLIANYLVPTFDRYSGAVDVSEMGRKRQVPGGETIEQMRDLMQSGFRIRSRLVEAFLFKAGMMALSNIFQFYTREQRFKLLGPDGVTLEDFDYDPGLMIPWSVPKYDHWKNFTVYIAQGTAHGLSQFRQQQMALVLYRLGAISRRELLRRMGITDIARIEQEIMEEQMNLLLAAAQAKGAGRVPRLTRSQRTGSPV